MARRKRRILFPFPIRGLDEFGAYRDQPPLTSPSLLNVRALEPVGDRVRGGVRPGLSKVYAQRVGGGAYPVRMLESVTRTRSPDEWTGTDSDDFNRPDSPYLGEGWYPHADGRGLEIVSNRATCPASLIDYYRCYRRLLRFSPYTEYSVAIDIATTGTNYAGVVVVALRMDDDSPDTVQDGTFVYCICIGPDASTSITLQGVTIASDGESYVYGGVVVSNVDGRGVATIPLAERKYATSAERTLRVRVLRDNIRVDLAGSSLLDDGVLPPQAGQRVGLQLWNAKTNRIFLDNWSVSGCIREGQAAEKQRRLVAVGNGQVWTDAGGASLAQVTGTYAAVRSDTALCATECVGRLFIADYADKALAQGTDGTVSGAGNRTFDAASVPDWRTLGADTDHYALELASLDREHRYWGVYRMAEIAAGHITLAEGFPTAGPVRYLLQRLPKVYDPASNAVSQYLATKGGGTPLGCPLITTFLGRVVMAGHAQDPQNYYQSRAFDPFDWDYARHDDQAAVAGHVATAGKIGAPITALIPFGDDFLLYGCVNSLWMQRGDLRVGGRIEVVSEHIGVIDRFAWCYEPQGGVFFLGRDGLYHVVPGGRPTPLSHTRLPRALNDIDTQTYEPRLAYDHEHGGVCIFITRRATGASTHYYYDVRTDGFFRDVLPDACGPTAAFNYLADDMARRVLLLGGRDGYLRRWDDSATTDDGQAITSRVVFAPQRLGGDDAYDGILDELVVALGEGTTRCDYEVRTAPTHEAVVASGTRSMSGTWTTGGLQTPIRARLRGGSIALVLGNDTSGATWALERIVGTAVTAGRVRR